MVAALRGMPIALVGRTSCAYSLEAQSTLASAAASLGGADAVAAFWVDSMPDGAAVHDALKAELGQKTVPYGEWLSIRCCTSKSAAHPLQLRLLQLLPNRRLHLSMQEAR